MKYRREPVTNCRTCGKCKHHRYDRESDGSSVCENDKSEHFAEYTEDTDTCDKWEGRRCR